MNPAGVKDPQLVIRLVPNPKLLREVTVAGNRRAAKNRANFLERFREQVIGTTRNASFCTIVNPEALEFRETKDTLNVTPGNPLRSGTMRWVIASDQDPGD